MMSLKAKIGLGVVTLLLLLAGIGLVTHLERVQPGYVGVEYSVNGGVTGEVYGQGWHIMKPFHNLRSYPVSTETVHLTKDSRDGSEEDESLMVSTRDGKPVNVGIVYSYSMVPEQTPDLFTRFRGRSNIELQNSIMKDRLYQVVQEVVSRESVLDVYSDKRSDINLKAFEAFRDEMEPYGIKIESFNFAEVIPDDETMVAIQATVDAQQEIRLLEVEQEKAIAEAERKRIEAEGNAEAELIRAKAEAEANQIINESISKTLVQYRQIDKWNGELPKVSGDVSPIVDIRE